MGLCGQAPPKSPDQVPRDPQSSDVNPVTPTKTLNDVPDWVKNLKRWFTPRSSEFEWWEDFIKELERVHNKGK